LTLREPQITQICADSERFICVICVICGSDDLLEMLLKITHETDLSYSDLITESVMELRVMPRQEQGQHRLAFSLAIGPQTSVSSYFDWLGNTVHAFTVNEPHREIKIVASSIVETEQ